MIRLLAKIPAFKRAVLRYAFTQQSKPAGKERLTQVFVDSEGRKYYRYRDDMHLPLARIGAIQDTMTEYESCIGTAELDMFLEAMNKCYSEIPGYKQTPGRAHPLATINILLDEMQTRRKYLFRADLLLKLIAVTLIREDETPEVVDEQIWEQKIAQFKKDSGAGGGLQDFFYKTGFGELLPFAKKSEGDWQAYLETNRIYLEKMDGNLKNIISGKGLSLTAMKDLASSGN